MATWTNLGAYTPAVMTTAERDADFPSPPNNLTIFNTTIGMYQVFVQERWVSIPQYVKVAETTAPGVGDDSDDFYVIGDRWLDVTNDEEYVCLDVTVGAAVWKRTTDDIKGLQFIIDGGGSVITTGVKGTIIVPFACEIIAWNIVGDQSGSINVDVNRSAWNTTPSYSSIAASAHPALSSAIAAEDTTLTGWTKTLAARDILQIEIDSVATITRCTVLLKVRRT